MTSKYLGLSLTTAALAVCAATTPSAMAVDHDSGAWISNYWNTGKVLKEWLDWRAALGWGLIGSSNAIITATQGASKGDVTRAVVSTMCGTTAAGVLATWKPLSEPTTASHVKAIVKGASVVAASSACGWMTHYAFRIIDNGIGPAQRSINSLSPQDTSTLKSTMEDQNKVFLAWQNELEYYNSAVAESQSALQRYHDMHCQTPHQDYQCNDAWDNYQTAEGRKRGLLQNMNDYGDRLHKNIQKVNQLVHS
jgi:hypothetical protein